MTDHFPLQRIEPDELPALLNRVADEERDELMIVGPGVTWLSGSPENWPRPLQERRLYQITAPITCLPRELWQLSSLRSLTLWHLDIGDSDAIAIAMRLPQLTTLNLPINSVGDTAVTSIANCLGQVRSLELEGNHVSDDGVRAIAYGLPQVKKLGLAGNSVSDVGLAAIGEHLHRLVELNLESNEQVTTIAPLAKLSGLSTLNIAKTGVTDLSPLKSRVLAGAPVKWSESTWEGPGIYVRGCPLTHPTVEVVRQGPEAVLNYFREIEAQGVDQLFEAKVLIVGEGGAGKTSLIRRLYQPELPLPAEDETTRGIDVHRHDFRTAAGRDFRINVWDFGGQQIYHATHQFFLTKNSLYVLVDDTRSDHKSVHDDGFKYWLEVIETFSDGSPVLIFQNEKGGRSKQIDEAGIKGRFPNVVGVYRGNLEHPDAADAVRRAVEHFTQELPHIGDAVPKKWVSIRESLEELAQSRPYIPQDEYFGLYEQHLELDRVKALHLSRYLHDLGVCLHFQQSRELRRTVFLQNQWVTDAVFRILDDEVVKTQRGQFTLQDCDRLWTDDGYENMELELRALMVQFELCYQLPDTGEETWLAPQLFSPSKPAVLKDWAAPGDLVLTYRYAFLPKGLVSRLIVRMHRFVRQPDLCWNQGVLFEQGETQVLVETAARGNEIGLRARGPEGKALLSVIASDLDALNASFEGLADKVGKWVPCVCDDCVKLTEPHLFEQQHLLRRKRHNRLTIECPKSYADVEVLELLDGLKPEQLPAWATETPNGDRPYAIAVSFPGEHRPFVQEIVERLAEVLGRDRVFYDEWYEARLLGRDGDLKLQSAYEDAELVVPFFSEHYLKRWCAMEWETIRGILLNRRADDAVIPVRLDETEIPGWPAVAFDIRPKNRSANEIADLILEAYRLRHPD